MRITRLTGFERDNKLKAERERVGRLNDARNAAGLNIGYRSNSSPSKKSPAPPLTQEQREDAAKEKVLRRQIADRQAAAADYRLQLAKLPPQKIDVISIPFPGPSYRGIN